MNKEVSGLYVCAFDDKTCVLMNMYISKMFGNNRGIYVADKGPCSIVINFYWIL